jgi:hypothetical protein
LRASESLLIRKATAVLLTVTLLAGAVIIDSVIERIYFYSNWIRLENAAGAAAMAGSSYLPANPAMALKAARKYAVLNGVRPGEIVSAKVSPDDSAITIKLSRRIPFYLSGVAVGDLANSVTAVGEAGALQGRQPHSGWIQV